MSRRLSCLALGSMVMLSACQLVDTAKIKHVSETKLTQKNALIYCAGTQNCEFERLNDIRIVDAERHRVYREAIRAGILRLQERHVRKDNALYLSIPEAQHELVVRFYPVSPQKAETLHLIHRFKAQQHYTLSMYRQPRKQTQRSLLKRSAPEPLCVDLKQQRITIRRFCKQHDALSGHSEFVEQKI
jgi:hypothetical protein